MSAANELERLAALRASGDISEEEFNHLKRKVLYEGAQRQTAGSVLPDWQDLKVHQKWWFQALLSILLPIIGFLVMLSSKAFYKKRDGTVAKRHGLAKFGFTLLVILVWGYHLATFGQLTNGFPGKFASSVPSCDSWEAKAALTDAIENSVENRQYNYRLLDLRDIEQAEELVGETRRCNARFVLNTGTERTGFSIDRTSDGMVLVEILPEAYPVAEGWAVPKAQEARRPRLAPAITATEPALAIGSDEDLNDASTAPYEQDGTSLSLGVLTSRPELPNAQVHELRQFLLARDLFPGRVSNIIASTELDDGRLVVLVETPYTDHFVEGFAYEDGPAGCHACAPPLSLAWFSAPQGGTPHLLGSQLDFDENGVGSWGKTSEVGAATLPDGDAAFAFATSDFAMGESFQGCIAYSVKDEVAVGPFEEFECP